MIKIAAFCISLAPVVVVESTTHFLLSYTIEIEMKFIIKSELQCYSPNILW